MACTGAHCTEHGTGRTTCLGHRGPCPSNNTYYSPTVAPVGGIIYASDVEALRQKIITEYAAYNNWFSRNPVVAGLYYAQRSTVDPGYFYAGSAGGGRQIAATDINNLESAVWNLNSALFPFGQSYSNRSSQTTDAATPGVSAYASQSTVYGLHWTTLVNKYNVMAHDCICNSDCACNNVCACHNDCGCNYSDIRLKENISFVETKEGINVYSYNYIWDKNKIVKGVMAHELLNTDYSHAVIKDRFGFYQVNYNKLPFQI